MATIAIAGALVLVYFQTQLPDKTEVHNRRRQDKTKWQVPERDRNRSSKRKPAEPRRTKHLLPRLDVTRSTKVDRNQKRWTRGPVADHIARRTAVRDRNDIVARS